MASHLQDRMATMRQQPQMPWIARQALLVPESVLLLAVLAIHWLSGGSALSALLGVLFIALFAARVGLITAARHALANTHYERANRLITVALMVYPWSADALALRGSIMLTTGEAALAETTLRKAIKLFPGLPVVHLMLSNALMELDRTIEARWEAMHALSLDKSFAPIYLQLAQVEQRLGAPTTDIEQRLRHGLSLQPDPATEGALRCALALVLLTLKQEGESRLAVAGVESLATRCSPVERAALLFHLGEVRRAQGDAEAARGFFRASEQLDPHGRHAAAAWRAARL